MEGESHRLSAFGSVFRSIIDLIFPRTCAHCGKLIAEETPLEVICDECRQQFRLLETGFTRTHILSRLTPCYLDGLQVAFGITPEILTIIHLVKYQKMPDLGVRLGLLAGEKLRGRLAAVNAGMILHPIPLFRRRRRKRGYNQSLCIARGMGRVWQTPVENQKIFRVRNTASQTTLDRQHRFENVSQAFRVKPETDFAFDTVVLIDDVVTTGATMNECARVLKAAGVRRVLGAAVATPLPGSLPDTPPEAREFSPLSGLF